jgi:hypothetical protein
LGDIQVNEDGSKTMNDKDQKIIHRWNYELEKSTWTTQSSKNIGKVLKIFWRFNTHFSKFVNPLNFVF